MEAYEKKYKILSCDVDMRRRLRIGRLFTLLQEAAIAHTEALGAGRAKTLDRGWLWVVTVQQAKIARLPEYDETIRLTSLPGEMMHTIYPRYYQIEDAQGNELVNASALWVLVDRETRALTDPAKTGVSIDGVKPDGRTLFPRPPKLPGGENDTAFTVPYSYVDLNGHMNNTKYFDLAEDLMPPALRDGNVRDISVEYTGEARLGDRMILSRSAEDGTFLLSGRAEKRLFRLGMRYE